MGGDTPYDRQWDVMSDDELQSYARSWGIERREELSRDELVKALKSRVGTTGTAKESSLPTERKGEGF